MTDAAPATLPRSRHLILDHGLTPQNINQLKQMFLQRGLPEIGLCPQDLGTSKWERMEKNSFSVQVREVEVTDWDMEKQAYVYIAVYLQREKRRHNHDEENGVAEESFPTLGPQAVLTMKFKFYSFHSFIYKLKDSDFQVESTLSLCISFG